MNLANKKELAAKTLGVGKGRIIFDNSRIDEIKEAITKQDIRDLNSSGAIKIKEIGGRRKNIKRKHRRGVGKIKVKVNTRKQDYVKLTRKLRDYVQKLKEQGKIDLAKYKELRKQIRNKSYRSKKNLRDSLGE